ncbi:MAG TPA: hypothetical protein PLK13_07925, partial [Xanthobacteraceae bacterium]|nr:hypothetical protein [Xanthobacteraceae bacterium]
RIPLLAWIVLPLAACDPSGDLPPMPSDLRACLSQEGVAVPDRALKAGEVERSWKEDRRVQAAVRRCGLRALAWYDNLRKAWR